MWPEEADPYTQAHGRALGGRRLHKEHSMVSLLGERNR